MGGLSNLFFALLQKNWTVAFVKLSIGSSAQQALQASASGLPNPPAARSLQAAVPLLDGPVDEVPVVLVTAAHLTIDGASRRKRQMALGI